jgi:hypothetical protein
MKKRAEFKLEAPGALLAADGVLVAVGDQAGRVYAWDGKRAKLLASQSVLPHAVVGLALSAKTGRAFAAASGERGSTLIMLTLPHP